LAAVKSILRVALAVVLTVVLGAASACAINPSSKASSARVASPSPAKVTPSPSKLDPEVAMPDGFPTDVPIYPGARLTAAAKFTSGAQTTWGMNWETLDSLDKVQAFYSAKLSQGDWTIQFKGSSNASFAATFSRKSNSKSSGILGADASSGVTKISLSLVN
jgi:hypothetical protein